MWKVVRFEVPQGGFKKYVAVLVDGHGKKKRVPFGDRRYEQFRDRIGHYAHLDHGDARRRRSYRARHAGEERRKYSPGWFAWTYLW